MTPDFCPLGLVVRPDDADSDESNSMRRRLTLSKESDSLCVQLQWSWEAPERAHLELTNGISGEGYIGTHSRVDRQRTRVRFEHLPLGQEFHLTLRNISDEIVLVDLCPGEKTEHFLLYKNYIPFVHFIRSRESLKSTKGQYKPRK